MSFRHIHDHRLQLCCPYVLSLIDEPLTWRRGVVHRITFRFSDFLSTYVLFTHFILDIK